MTAAHNFQIVVLPFTSTSKGRISYRIFPEISKPEVTNRDVIIENVSRERVDARIVQFLNAIYLTIGKR